MDYKKSIPMDFKVDEYSGFAVEGTLLDCEPQNPSFSLNLVLPAGILAARVALNLLLWKGRVWGFVKESGRKRLLKVVLYGEEKEQLDNMGEAAFIDKAVV